LVDELSRKALDRFDCLRENFDAKFLGKIKGDLEEITISNGESIF
jgi:hypothetical protein